MSVCTAFIFTALLEFTLVNQLSRPRRQMVCWVMHVTKGVPERQLYMPDLCEDWCVVRQQLKKVTAGRAETGCRRSRRHRRQPAADRPGRPSEALVGVKDFD